MNRSVSWALAVLLSIGPSVRAQVEPTSGLCVVAPAVDGVDLSRRTNDGRMLVHGLALSADASNDLRRRVLTEKRYGLASAAHWRDPHRLPYADNLIDLLIVDMDAFEPGGVRPARDEMLRVVAPEGLLKVREKGAWIVTRKPRPADIDGWGHFDCGADGNALSHDRKVAPPRLPQWLTGIQANAFEGNPAGYQPGGGVRINGRFAVIDVVRMHENSGAKAVKTELLLQGRDAFNGLPLWTIPRDAGVAKRRWSLVADSGRVYTYLESGGDLTALDIATGKVLHTFPGTAPKSKDKKTAGLSDELTCVRAAGSTLVVNVDDRILCFDAETGKLRWTFRLEGKLLLAPTLDAALGQVHGVVAAPGPGRIFGARWPDATMAESVVALDLADGKLLWENTDVASKTLPPRPRSKEERIRGIGQLLVAGPHLVCFGSCSIGGGNSPFLASLDLKTGRTLHIDDEPFERSYNVSSYNALVRDGAVWFAGAFTNFWRYDPATGKTEKALTMGFNQRCTRLTATDDFFLFGQAAYWDKAFAGVQACVARSGCAMGNIPANGMTYFTPNACGCITQMRGFQALSSERMPTPLAEDQRRRTDGTPLDDVSPQMPTGPIVDEWHKQWRAPREETEPVKAGDFELVAVVHQHRLESRSGGKTRWAFFAEGRISSPPIVLGDQAFFGSHDGWVYAVAVKDGRLRWKFLVAPSERNWVCHGQLESTWPVYGVAMRDGNLVASAGTHVELGDVVVVGLDPESGKAAWRRTLHKDSSVIPPGGKGAKIAAFSFLNSVPRIEEGRIRLGDGGLIGGEFSFVPEESDESLRIRLSGLQPKSK